MRQREELAASDRPAFEKESVAAMFLLSTPPGGGISYVAEFVAVARECVLFTTLLRFGLNRKSPAGCAGLCLTLLTSLIVRD